MMHELIIAGFGGQGVMSMGQWLTSAGMKEGKYVTWLPSYGPEQRGGTANVSVVISDDPVGSPVVTKPMITVVLNNPSFDKFEPKVKPGGYLFINSSLVERTSKRTDIEVVEIPATEIANELGNTKVANSVILGSLLENTHLLSEQTLRDTIVDSLSGKNDLVQLNLAAFEEGKGYSNMVNA
ncbi:2-oxoacid:acceptor oxidoreductase family protein [Bacillaceae bacterium S4-13-56]